MQSAPQGKLIHIPSQSFDVGQIDHQKSCSYLLALAVKALYPNALPITSFATENTFYYDFLIPNSLTPQNLIEISTVMEGILKTRLAFNKTQVSRVQAIKFMEDKNDPYKLKTIESFEESKLFIYEHQYFYDIENKDYNIDLATSMAFKLTGVSGAYWLNDSKNIMLQRISGTAWPNIEKLALYLNHIEELQQSDHREIGKNLDLFHFEENAQGAVFWHPHGWSLFQSLIGYMRKQHFKAGYVEVNTPDLMNKSLWEISGHWQNYRNHMFTSTTEDGKTLALKPMNCPGAVTLYKHEMKSYRQLPLKMAEFGKVHRYEPSGSLHGLMRVRHFTQDDAHIFCTQEQLQEEVQKTIQLILSIYADFNFKDIEIKLSTRPENRIGTDAGWNFLEQALEQAIRSLKLNFNLNEGEGAFYGPKIEFVLSDLLGRKWQCGTIQVDLSLPERFELSYVDEDGKNKSPIMLHRAVFGSLERFIGILLENTAGKLPVWLAPVQVSILTISSQHEAYAKEVYDELQRQNIRASLNFNTDKINKKIKLATLQKIPYMVIIGNKEVETCSLTLRTLSGESASSITMQEIISAVRDSYPEKKL